VLLVGLGVGVGRLAPRVQVVGTGAAGGLLVLGIALLVMTPLTTSGAPASFVSLVSGEAIVSLLGVTGAAVLGARALARRAGSPRLVAALAADRPVLADVRGSVGAAALAVAGIYVLLAPLGTVFHRLVPTPERLVALVLVAAIGFPFALAFETVVRRGPTVPATLWCLLGRVGFLVILAVSVRLGLLPEIVSLVIPVFAVLLAIFEVFAVAAYASGRNVVVIAVAEAVFLAWFTAVTMPITF